ncbi:MAG: hypothetical protein KGY65_02970 [Candidatus Thermoplasmatota archaeon]|nr:hypothetical protein [Candidatus Thermoplasmatota archaeon]MBS3801691.1 hypothetical protein [Candidatus Thermoplasmatota archaeon]
MILCSLCIFQGVKKLNEPWSNKQTGRSPHSAKVVSFCCTMKVATIITYGEIESYVKMIAENIKKRFHVDPMSRGIVLFIVE